MEFECDTLSNVMSGPAVDWTITTNPSCFLGHCSARSYPSSCFGTVKGSESATDNNGIILYQHYVLFLSQTQCPSVTHTISNQITIILSVMHAVSLVVSLELCDIAISVYKRRATSGLTTALSLRTIVSSYFQTAPPPITCCIDC